MDELIKCPHCGHDSFDCLDQWMNDVEMTWTWFCVCDQCEQDFYAIFPLGDPKIEKK